MGVDIHFVVLDKKENKMRELPILDGYRNTEWFDNITGNYSITNRKYQTFPALSVTSDDVKLEISEALGGIAVNNFYGYFMLKVSDFKVWYDKVRPRRRAGWFNSYDRWCIESFGWIPNPDTIDVIKPNSNDATFIEYDDNYEGSYLLLQELAKTCNDSTILYFCFDR